MLGRIWLSFFLTEICSEQVCYVLVYSFPFYLIIRLYDSTVPFISISFYLILQLSYSF